MEKKTKEQRKFNKQWEFLYFFIEYKDKARCLFCDYATSSFKKHTLESHLHRKHWLRPEVKLSEDSRIDKARELKDRFLNSRIDKHFVKTEGTNLAAKIKLFENSLTAILVREGKPFSDIEIFKEVLSLYTREFFPNKGIDINDFKFQSYNYITKKDENFKKNKF
ncbi:hypothetical protein EHP00_1837 [Ecytonucleospora hepatopenaei]|uniref:BED-type domain-containing protein n=1 Tax=Ecytonucleospora hepatopenaei TaxID=646526 RepID=A0A1W0E547_9MICR|nr:hypothetical protein EHP00_1837 [Ecytonucleospora hepatopenaei]